MNGAGDDQGDYGEGDEFGKIAATVQIGEEVCSGHHDDCRDMGQSTPQAALPGDPCRATVRCGERQDDEHVHGNEDVASEDVGQEPEQSK